MRGKTEFDRWFGASKVVYRDKPLLMWHGTTKKFTVFDKSFLAPSGAYGPGFYFTSDYELAKMYSGDGEPVPAYLSIKKPWTQDRDEPYDSPRHRSFRGMSGQLRKKGYDGVLVIEGNYREAVALEPEQIMIVTGAPFQRSR